MLCPRCLQDIDEQAATCPYCAAIGNEESGPSSAKDPAQIVLGAPSGQPPQPVPPSQAPAQPAVPSPAAQSQDPPVPIPGMITPVTPVAPGAEPDTTLPTSPGPSGGGPKRTAQLKLVGGLSAVLVFVVFFTDFGYEIRLGMGLAKPRASATTAPASPSSTAQPATQPPPASSPAPAQPAVQPPPPASPAPAQPAAQPSPAAQAPASEPGEGAQAPEGDGGKGSAAAEPPAAAVTWVFEGRVYDMISLKPVKGAQLAFMGGEDEVVVTTDARGRYQAKLAAIEGGYTLVVDHPDYNDGYFDEADPPYAKRSLARRNGMRTAKPSHEAWVGDEGTSRRRDVVLFPAVTD